MHDLQILDIQCFIIYYDLTRVLKQHSLDLSGAIFGLLQDSINDTIRNVIIAPACVFYCYSSVKLQDYALHQ